MPKTTTTNTRSFGAAPDAFDGETNFGLGSFKRELDLKIRRLQCKGSATSVRKYIYF